MNTGERVKVLFDARMLGHSGIGTQVFNVLRELENRKELNLALAGNPEIIERTLPDFRGDVVDFSAGIYSISEQLFFPSADKTSLLHIPHYNAPIRHLRRSIVVVHDLIHLQSEEFASPVYRLYATLLLSQISRKALHIATVSKTTEDELCRRFPAARGKTSVIYNGLDHSLFHPAKSGVTNSFRKKYHLPLKFLLCVGIGKKHKNVDFVVRELSPLWKSRKLKLPLVIAGSGGSLPEYVKQELDRQQASEFVISLPYLEDADLALLYTSAHVFIMPSLLEGFGFPVIEAMACGTPVLCSNASCLPEIGADAALYFDPRNGESFRASLAKLLGSEALMKELKKSGLQRARFFSWKKHADELMKLYHRFNLAASSSPIS